MNNVYSEIAYVYLHKHVIVSALHLFGGWCDLGEQCLFSEEEFYWNICVLRVPLHGKQRMQAKNGESSGNTIPIHFNPCI